MSLSRNGHPRTELFQRGSRAERKGGRTMPSHKTAKAPPGRTNWEALRAMSDDEIERMAAEDEDNPATDEAHWTNATVILPSGKASMHVTVDQDVVEFFK